MIKRYSMQEDSFDQVIRVGRGVFAIVEFPAVQGRTLTIWAREDNEYDFDLLVLRSEDVEKDAFWVNYAFLHEEHESYYQEELKLSESGSMCLIVSNLRGKWVMRKVHLKISVSRQPSSMAPPSHPVSVSPSLHDAASVTVGQTDKVKLLFWVTFISEVAANLAASLIFLLTQTQNLGVVIGLNLLVITLCVLFVLVIQPKMFARGTDPGKKLDARMTTGIPPDRWPIRVGLLRRKKMGELWHYWSLSIPRDRVRPRQKRGLDETQYYYVQVEFAEYMGIYRAPKRMH